MKQQQQRGAERLETLGRTCAGNNCSALYVLFEKGINHLAVAAPQGVKVGDHHLLLLERRAKRVGADQGRRC